MSNSINDCTLFNTVEGSVNVCTGEVEYASYGYTPGLGACAAFVALYALTTLAHLFQGVTSKRWYMLCTFMICGIGEILGWSGRLWSNISAEWNASLGGYWYSNDTAFMIQIATLIFSPAFMAAGLYITLGKLVKVSPQYCRFNPLTYAILFVSGDVISLVVQAIGGGVAAGADDRAGADNGANIMVGGVIAQMAVMVLFTVVLLEYIYRYFTTKPVTRHFRIRKTSEIPRPIPVEALTPAHNRNIKLTILALCFATLVLFIRSIYRTIELLDGWNGDIIENESLFNFFDGLMILLAMVSFNVIHPSWSLPRPEDLDYVHNMEKVGSQSSQTAFNPHVV